MNAFLEAILTFMKNLINMLEKLPAKKAYIFDMDGVIVDNIEYHIKALKQFLARFGKEVDDEYFQKHLNGRTMQEVVLSLKPEASHDEILELTEEKESLYREIYGKNLAPTSGLISFLEEAKHAGIKMAVATSAITSNVEFTLDGLHIRKYFDAIIDSTMVTKGKPDPEIYIKAAETLSCEPNDCLVFEDALAGIESAHNAGIDVVGLATSLNFKQLPDKVILKTKDFTELSVSTL